MGYHGLFVTDTNIHLLFANPWQCYVDTDSSVVLKSIHPLTNLAVSRYHSFINSNEFSLLGSFISLIVIFVCADLEYNNSYEYLDPNEMCSLKTVSCAVEASTSILNTCQYRWVDNTTGRSVTSSSILSLSDVSPGVYVCTVECQVRGGRCLSNPRTVDTSKCPSIISIIIGFLSN